MDESLIQRVAHKQERTRLHYTLNEITSELLSYGLELKNGKVVKSQLNNNSETNYKIWFLPKKDLKPSVISEFQQKIDAIRQKLYGKYADYQIDFCSVDHALKNTIDENESNNFTCSLDPDTFDIIDHQNNALLVEYTGQALYMTLNFLYEPVKEFCWRINSIPFKETRKLLKAS